MSNVTESLLEIKIADSTKTGYSFNIPAGYSNVTGKQTCVGMTAKCFEICYGRGGRFRPGMNGTITTEHNLAALEQDVNALERVKWPSGGINEYRLLGTGDMYSLEFGRSMFRMCDQNPTKGFWMYTRSFDILRQLLAERSVPANLVLFVSADVDNVKEAEDMADLFDLPVAYMGDDVAPDRDAFVCPSTTGDPRFALSRKKSEAPCLKCRYCVDRKASFAAYRVRKGVRFYYH